MFRKSFIKFFFVAAIAAFGSISALAQSSPVSGTVEVVNADGSRAPVAGATIECFRTDIKASQPAAKTNAKGQFSFAGLQLGWTFVLSVSGPGIAPNYMPNVRGGQEKILITVYPGDGSKMPEDEVRKAVTTKSTGTSATTQPQNTDEMKKAQADFEAKKKEVEEKNKKASTANEVTTRSIKEGKEAMDAKNYDVAIIKYQEGYAADPDFVGSAPIFLLNKGIAHTQRAVETHNASVKTSDATEKVAAAGKVRQDLLDAAEGYLKAINIQKKAPSADISDRANFEAVRINLLRASIDAFKRAVETERVDPTIIDIAKTLIPEYMTVETESARKVAVSLVLPDMYRIQGDSENAIAGYKQMLETSPDNPDALVGAGLSLVNLGFINDDKAKLQEGANYLQKFVSVAPDTHKLKVSAADSIKYLKEQNITPVKSTAPKKKP